MTASDIKARFPEFANEVDERIDIFLSDAETFVVDTVWGKLYDQGIAYLTAHLLSLSSKTASGDESPSAEVASESVDGVSVSYATSQTVGSDSYYASTQYGKTYLALRSQIALGNVRSV